MLLIAKAVHAQAPTSVRDGQVRAAGTMGPPAMSQLSQKASPSFSEEIGCIIVTLHVSYSYFLYIFSIFLYSFRNLIVSGKWPTCKLLYKMMVFCLLLNYTAPPYKAPTAFEIMGDLSYVAYH